MKLTTLVMYEPYNNNLFWKKTGTIKYDCTYFWW